MSINKVVVLNFNINIILYIFAFAEFQFFYNNSYLAQYHNAGVNKKDSVPGHAYFAKIEKFIANHYEEGENYREYLKFSCQGKVGSNCSFCNEWTGPRLARCPKPIPNNSCLLDYLYHSYSNTSIN